ncbi:MAG: transposase zinc-binding domain-containing protein [Planctomycetes bacterium]|nr:transposase zinc-binding domain-containing protein [Planctomycetota bacterium]
MLYRVVQGAWAGVRAGLALRERPLPRFCAREVESFLRCGILAHGVARVWCSGCGKDDVVAFSCKGRGFCPSCGARRMADTALWLVDRVIPDEAPVRQWVLSLPHRLRVLCAYDPDACALVRRVLLRTVSGWYEGRARRQGLPRSRTGAVAFVQRFDSGLRLNVHFHVLWLDGVIAHATSTCSARASTTKPSCSIRWPTRSASSPATPATACSATSDLTARVEAWPPRLDASSRRSGRMAAMWAAGSRHSGRRRPTA